ncbi:MAG TPA: hypothetical protein VHN14_18965 [Kofleriaceae bacterium]|nr:hypothetical protein [Kofleriaceae bacterium]
MSALIDHVLREHAPWISDVLDVAPEGIRTWIGDGEGHDFFDLHRISAYARQHLARVPQGHFNGQPGAPGALMARTTFSIARALSKSLGSEAIDGVVLVWDMDGHATDRKLGLDQARAEAQKLVPFRILLGCPDRMREAWVLAGFDPQSQDERDRLDHERQQLGFHPCAEAHLLTAADELAKRSAKRVLAVLTGGAWEREAQCWSQSALATLRERGMHSGLVKFLAEIEERLVPLSAAAPAPAPAPASASAPSGSSS